MSVTETITKPIRSKNTGEDHSLLMKKKARVKNINSCILFTLTLSNVILAWFAASWMTSLILAAVEIIPRS